MRLAIGEQCSSISGDQHRTRTLLCLSFLLVTGDFGQAFSKLAESPVSKRVNTGNFRIVHLCLLRANLFRSRVSYAAAFPLKLTATDRSI